MFFTTNIEREYNILFDIVKCLPRDKIILIIKGIYDLLDYSTNRNLDGVEYIRYNYWDSILPSLTIRFRLNNKSEFVIRVVSENNINDAIEIIKKYVRINKIENIENL